ncbi:hypothetical protein L195_g038744, partial [Trifolium pratense]
AILFITTSSSSSPPLPPTVTAADAPFPAVAGRRFSFPLLNRPPHTHTPRSQNPRTQYHSCKVVPSSSSWFVHPPPPIRGCNFILLYAPHLGISPSHYISLRHLAVVSYFIVASCRRCITQRMGISRVE